MEYGFLFAFFAIHTIDTSIWNLNLNVNDLVQEQTEAKTETERVRQGNEMCEWV